MTNEKLSTLTVEAFNAMSDKEQHEVLDFINSDECTIDLSETDLDLFNAIMDVDLADFEKDFAERHPDYKPIPAVVVSDFE